MACPIGNDAFAVNSALEIVRDGEAEQLARILPRMPDKASANLVATNSTAQRTSYIELVMDPELSLPACQQADTSAMWMLEHLLELPGTADESSFFEDGCPANRLTLQPHEQAQATPSTGAGGLDCRRLNQGGCQHPSGTWWRRCQRFLLTSLVHWGVTSGWSCPVRTSFDAYGVASGIFAISMGYRRNGERGPAKLAAQGVPRERGKSVMAV